MVDVVHDRAEIVIVGAGAAGIHLAARLSQAGKAVVVLEAGPPWTLDDLVSSQIYARRLRWGGAAIEKDGDNPFDYQFNAGWGYGGAALHHYGTWPRLTEEDFKVKSLYGRGLDWPIGYDDLRPYYDRVQAKAGMAGDAAREVWRGPGAAYPQPALPLFPQARILQQGFDAIGKQTAPAPMAILSTEYNGRAPCIYDGWCDAGCPTGALANPLVVWMPEAQDAEFRPYATATEIIAAGNRAEAVAYRDAEGRLHHQPGDVIILAANAVETPRLLLNSVSAAHPDGLANGNGLVGRYFMTHGLQSAYGLFDAETAPFMGVTGAQLMMRDLAPRDSRAGMFGSYQWLIAPAVKPNDLPGLGAARMELLGAELDAFMRRAMHGLGFMLAMIEGLPLAENRVTLAQDRDAHGVRRARVSHSFEPAARALAGYVRDEGLAVMAAAGAVDRWTGTLATAHMMGGTVMGDDAAHSVCDDYGRSWQVPNLVLAGTGIMPGVGPMNPTFTLHALAERTADHMIAHWGDYR